MTRVREQTKSAIDKIGERLKAGDFSSEALRGLDMFRSSHDRIVPMVLHAVSNRGTLSLRAAKSTASIVAKLRRESVRLSQIQDIAGCRLIVPDVLMQAEFIEDSTNKLKESALQFLNPDALLGFRFDPGIQIALGRLDGVIIEPKRAFSRPRFEPVSDDLDVSVRIIDRLLNPQFGYRAMHVVVGYRSRFMEVQVRTQLQHAWAELSEKAADKYGHEMKYGRGNNVVLDELIRLSDQIHRFEDYELEHYFDDETVDELEEMRKHILDLITSEAFKL